MWSINCQLYVVICVKTSSLQLQGDAHHYTTEEFLRDDGSDRIDWNYQLHSVYVHRYQYRIASAEECMRFSVIFVNNSDGCAELKCLEV